LLYLLRLVPLLSTHSSFFGGVVAGVEADAQRGMYRVVLGLGVVGLCVVGHMPIARSYLSAYVSKLRWCLSMAKSVREEWIW
jgi:hypothetical protein